MISYKEVKSNYFFKKLRTCGLTQISFLQTPEYVPQRILWRLLLYWQEDGLLDLMSLLVL